MDRQELALAAREALGLTQREFAALIGVGYVTVARWESPTNPRDPGAVGEALFRLIIDSPRRSKRALSERTSEEPA